MAFHFWRCIAERSFGFVISPLDYCLGKAFNKPCCLDIAKVTACLIIFGFFSPDQTTMIPFQFISIHLICLSIFIFFIGNGWRK